MTAEPATTGSSWRDLVVDGRLPRFALVCAGTWLAAADELVTATVMPSAARDIGGYTAFGWAVAIFLLGSILGGATAGRLTARFGLRTAMAIAGATYALGCAASALAPDIGVFLAGRLAQGLGGGWVVGLSYVASTSLFPEALWSRVLSGLAGVWGVATLVSPLIGGVFAEIHFWRGAFWTFAAQGLAFIVATAFLVPRGAARGEASGRPPVLQVAVLALSVAAIGAAGLLPTPLAKGTAGLAGIALLALFLRIDTHAPTSLLPRQTGRPASAVAAGLFMIFTLNAATVSFSVYGTSLMQRLYGATPILAGYILGGGALGWTLSALVIAGRGWARGYIRLGVALIAATQVAMMFVVPHGSIAAIAALVFVSGAGFGMAWAFVAARIVANTDDAERPLASGSVPTASMIGAAVAAAAAGSIATALGVGRGMSLGSARAAGFWLFAAFLPLLAAAVLAAWRLTNRRFDPPSA
ncbi:MAG TPA: MFS transporter [Caulobacteraceae bacterium]|nr:MFS transporter [Caulobacteraceae bacterium]